MTSANQPYEPRCWLRPGERILWQGAPPQRLRFYANDRWLLPFGLWFLGFALFWDWKAWTEADRQPGNWGGWAMVLWGFPFILMGLFLVIGRFVVDWSVRRHQRYYITDLRVLVVRHGWRGRIIEASSDFLPFVKVIKRKDGSGDIRFGPTRYKRSAKTGQLVERDLLVPSLNPTPQFLGLADPDTVFNLLEDTNRRRRASLP